MNKESPYTVTRNACKLCNPLGACLVFRGIERCVPLLHGSQGCSTYIRRYMISHFKEPIDIASSNFSEDTAIFGGSSNLKYSIKNISAQYRPDLIGIASTCLSETIGDDVSMILKEYRDDKDTGSFIPKLVSVSTPSYHGTHADGFYNAVQALITTLSEGNGEDDHVTVLPGMLSPADIRHIKEIMTDFNIEPIIVPDYSETLDGPLWNHYERISPGGTPVKDLVRCGSSAHCIEFTSRKTDTAGKILKDAHNVNSHIMHIPVGINLSDQFFSLLREVSGSEIPEKYIAARGRLIDAYADAHKHAYGIRAILYGEEDLVIPMVSFLLECGINPVLCATGSQGQQLKNYIRSLETNASCDPVVMGKADFKDIEEAAADADADIIIGSSKGFKLSQKLDLPLVRIGFPIHDRIGGGRIHHICYRGTMELFDRIINAHIAYKQDRSDVGYTYM